MNINIPTLTIKISIEPNYRYFNKNEFINIEGFANSGDICLVFINPPMVRPNFPFRGIKPVVCIIDNPTEEIINLCEHQKLGKMIREQSKSISREINTNLPFHKINNHNINNQDNIRKNKNNNIENLIKKKQSSQIINGGTSNNTSTFDATSNIDIGLIGNNLNNFLLLKTINKELYDNKRYKKDNIKNKNSNIKRPDIKGNDKQQKINNNLLYSDKNEYKSKSSNKEAQNNINLKNKNYNINYNNIYKSKIKNYFQT